jgi:hypothetical protein
MNGRTRRVGGQRLRGHELPRAAAAQPHPLPRCPAPPGQAGVGTVLQHDRRRVRAGTPETDVFPVMQSGQSLIQRSGQPGQRMPISCRSPWDTHSPPALQPDRTQRGEGRGLVVEQRDPAIPATAPPRAPRRLTATPVNRPRRCDDIHAGASGPAPGPVSLPIRHAWICAM